MPQTLLDLRGLLMKTLFKNLSLGERMQVLIRMLEAAIAARYDEASAELVRLLYGGAAFGLDREWTAALETESGLSADAFHSETSKRWQEFREILMGAYPTGSIRREGNVHRFSRGPEADLMKTRKQMLAFIVWEWDGSLDRRGEGILNFLMSTLVPAEEGVEFLEQEKGMILGVIRERLNAPVFTEEVLRRLLSRLCAFMDLDASDYGPLPGWEEICMVFAMAHTKKGGVRWVANGLEGLKLLAEGAGGGPVE